MNDEALKEQIDNDKELTKLMLNFSVEMHKYMRPTTKWEDLTAHQRSVVSSYRDELKEYTQSKLKAFAGDAEALLEYEDVERWSDPVDRQVAEECNQLKSNILKALKAIKEKYQL